MQQDPNLSKKHKQESLLLVAVRNNMATFLEDLIANGADINYINSNGHPLSHIAASKNNYDVAKVLSDHGVKFNFIDEYSCPSLNQAAKHGNINLIKLILASDNNIDINIKDAHGETIAHDLVVRGNIDCIKELISMGLDLNIKSNKGLCRLRRRFNYKKQ